MYKILSNQSVGRTFWVMKPLKITGSLLVLVLLSGCLSSYTYRAYLGAPRDALKVASVRGFQYARNDIINRYVDGVRFASIDEVAIADSVSYTALELAPGFHDLAVYFYWDMGSQKGLAAALVSYATEKDSMSRVLRFNAQAGKSYSVKATPHFAGSNENIASLSHVDFWVEDQNGVEIVSKEAGRYKL